MSFPTQHLTRSIEGVKTNGIGKKTTAHLNLTVPFRWSPYPPVEPSAGLRAMRLTRTIAPSVTPDGKIAPAGYDRMERA